MPKTNKNGILCPFRCKIDFEDLLILEKHLEKIFSHLLSVKLGVNNNLEG